jgi:hypothetical protein
MQCRLCVDDKSAGEEGSALTGLISRYHGSRGVFRSIMTSSYSRPISLSAMCAR